MADLANPYRNESGCCLFGRALQVYDLWLDGIPHVNSGTSGIKAYAQRQLVRDVWPAVEQLCIRLEAQAKGELASRIERAFRDAEDYARLIDNYCESDKFDFDLWLYGDPGRSDVEPAEGDIASLVEQAGDVGQLPEGEDFYHWSYGREWARELGQRSAQMEIDKYGHPPTDDYVQQVAHWAWACFWLATQFRHRNLDHHKAHGTLESYLSSMGVVSETKYPVIHEALGQAYGMSIYPIAPLESEEVSAALDGFVSVVMQTRDALGLRPQSAAGSGESKEVPWNPDDKDYTPLKDALGRAQKVREDLQYRDLNKAIRRDGVMRYMLNPDPKDKGPGSVHCKVNKDDLSTWLDGLKRAATANARQGEDNTPNPPDGDAGLYEKGFAKGRQEGYGQGYNDVKEGKPYSCKPPYQDKPGDQYVHGQYEGWKKGYAAGRADSGSGEPQKYGVQE